jgi:hypothetical protein
MRIRSKSPPLIRSRIQKADPEPPRSGFTSTERLDPDLDLHKKNMAVDLKHYGLVVAFHFFSFLAGQNFTIFPPC